MATGIQGVTVKGLDIIVASDGDTIQQAGDGLCVWRWHKGFLQEKMATFSCWRIGNKGQQVPANKTVRKTTDDITEPLYNIVYNITPCDCTT